MRSQRCPFFPDPRGKICHLITAVYFSASSRRLSWSHQAAPLKRDLYLFPISKGDLQRLILSTNCTFCYFDETSNSVKFVDVIIPFCRNIKFLKILDRKKKIGGFGRGPKACGNWDDKGKPVITSVTKVFHICWLTVVRNWASYDSIGYVPNIAMAAEDFCANSRLLYCTGTNVFLFQTIRMLIQISAMILVGYITVICVRVLSPLLQTIKVRNLLMA